ncbi:hypothetical protein [Subtercola lobariae]|nr:hypothetical protein [Subtercola lobariae]
MGAHALGTAGQPGPGLLTNGMLGSIIRSLQTDIAGLGRPTTP